jgi:hypothetical protein
MLAQLRKKYSGFDTSKSALLLGELPRKSANRLQKLADHSLVAGSEASVRDLLTHLIAEQRAHTLPATQD